MALALDDHQTQQATTPALALVAAANFLHEADKATPQLGVADLHERFDQFQSIGLCEKAGHVRGRRSFCSLFGVARDPRSIVEEKRHRDLEDVTHLLQPAAINSA